MNTRNEYDQAYLLTPVVLVIIFLLIALMQMTTDLYIPSLPAMTQSLHSTQGTIQLSLSLYLLGFCASHLLYGPLSDRIGRKKPIVIGICVSMVGSSICAWAPNAIILIIGRFIQGFGIGCCNSVGRSLARDLLSDRKLAKIGSYIGMVSVVFLAMSPTLGGYVQESFGWRVNFLILFGLGLFILSLVLPFLPETNRYLNPNAMNFSVMKTNYMQLLGSKIFMGYTLCACFAGAGLVAYLTIAPFLLQEKLGLSPAEFGWLAFVIAAAIFISGFINSLFVGRKGISFMVFLGIVLMLVAGIMLAFVAFLLQSSTAGIMVPVGIFSMGAGFSFINAFAGAFDPFPKIAGTAGALYGFLQDLCAAMVSVCIAFLTNSSVAVLAAIFLIFAVFSLLSWLILAKQRDVRPC